MTAECLWVGISVVLFAHHLGYKNRRKLCCPVGAITRHQAETCARIATQCTTAALIIVTACFVAACGSQQPVQLASRSIPGGVTSSVRDFHNQHMTNISTEDEQGHDLLADYDVPAEYGDLATFVTPAGLHESLK